MNQFFFYWISFYKFSYLKYYNLVSDCSCLDWVYQKISLLFDSFVISISNTDLKARSMMRIDIDLMCILFWFSFKRITLLRYWLKPCSVAIDFFLYNLFDLGLFSFRILWYHVFETDNFIYRHKRTIKKSPN